MQDEPDHRQLQFHAGTLGALLPFVVFLAGVAWLGLSGAPDERGLWPMLLAALAAGLVLAKERHAYAEAVIDGMARPLVALMILAWLLAGVFGGLLSAGGLVDALAGLAAAVGLSGGGYVVSAFVVACLLSAATGTSLGTLIVCFPLLYPAGAGLGADPVMLAGAILGGATFGDNVSPVSDTTIASATTQAVEIGAVVRSRLLYALPAAAVAATGYLIFRGDGASAIGATAAEMDAAGLTMLLAPGVAFVLLLRQRHLVEGLMAGIGTAILVGLAAGRFAFADLVRIDTEAFGARGLLVEGMERGIGISVFTLLLMGLVGAIEASGLLERLVDAARGATRTARGAEGWIFAAVSGATLFTTHAVVAILAVGEFARQTGERFGLPRTRTANLLDTTVCTYPFLLPWFVPTILAASLTQSDADAGMPRLSALQVGMANIHSWILLVIVVIAVATGYGRRAK